MSAKDSKDRRKKFYLDYIISKEWKAVRRRVILLRGYRCEVCGSQKNIQVHHLTYVRLGHELNKDLQILCSKCHKKAHGIGVKKKVNKKSLSYCKKVVLNKLSLKKNTKIYDGWIGLADKIRSIKKIEKPRIEGKMTARKFVFEFMEKENEKYKKRQAEKRLPKFQDIEDEYYKKLSSMNKSTKPIFKTERKVYKYEYEVEVIINKRRKK